MELRKGDSRKLLLAWLIRKRTSASNGWIAQRLGMGYPGSVSRWIGTGKKDGMLKKELQKLEEMLK